MLLVSVFFQAQWWPAKAEEPALAITAIEPTPTPAQEVVGSTENTQEGAGEAEVKVATITAYACGGLNTPEEIQMNCPSLFYNDTPKTASGEAPIPYETMACDKANMGREFEIEGLGLIRCNDTGSAIQGAGRFDIYLPTVEEARAWGVQKREYKLK